ncbi:hypothetical protein [Streptomyces poonensis]|nr:hypothetical protein [Streptomyces poonensis]
MNIGINYTVHAGSEFTEAHIEEMAKAPGRSALTIGKAKGDVSNTGGTLFVPCPTKDDPGSLVRIEAAYYRHPDDVQNSWKEDFRDLIISAARHVAQDVLKCEGSKELGENRKN